MNNTNDKEQLEALKQGFYEIIPKDINEVFNELDLKVYIKKNFFLYIIKIIFKYIIFKYSNN